MVKICKVVKSVIKTNIRGYNLSWVQFSVISNLAWIHNPESSGSFNDTKRGVWSSIVSERPLLFRKYFLIKFPHSVLPSSPVTKADNLMFPFSKGHAAFRLSPPPYQWPWFLECSKLLLSFLLFFFPSLLSTGKQSIGLASFFNDCQYSLPGKACIEGHFKLDTPLGPTCNNENFCPPQHVWWSAWPNSSTPDTFA